MVVARELRHATHKNRGHARLGEAARGVVPLGQHGAQMMGTSDSVLMELARYHLPPAGRDAIVQAVASVRHGGAGDAPVNPAHKASWTTEHIYVYITYTTTTW